MKEYLEESKDEWKDIPGTEGVYQASRAGFFRKSKSQKALKGEIINGYTRIFVRINGEPKRVMAHRLILLTFKENPENKPFVNHLNCERSDNRLENLEWCTASENIRYAFDYGKTRPFRGHLGTRNNRGSKLTETIVLKIRKEIRDIGLKRGRRTELSKKYGITMGTLWAVVKGKTWPHVNC